MLPGGKLVSCETFTPFPCNSFGPGAGIFFGIPGFAYPVLPITLRSLANLSLELFIRVYWRF